MNEQRGGGGGREKRESKYIDFVRDNIDSAERGREGIKYQRAW